MTSPLDHTQYTQYTAHSTVQTTSPLDHRQYTQYTAHSTVQMTSPLDHTQYTQYTVHSTQYCPDDVTPRPHTVHTVHSTCMWCAPPRQQDKLPVTPISVGSDSVTPVRCVRDLGIFIDSDMSIRTHVSKTVAKCFASLRRLQSIRLSVSQSVACPWLLRWQRHNLTTVMRPWRAFLDTW